MESVNEIGNPVGNPASYIAWQTSRLRFIVSLFDKTFLKDKTILELTDGISETYSCEVNHSQITIRSIPIDIFLSQPNSFSPIILTRGIVFRVKSLPEMLNLCLENCDYLFIDGFFANLQAEHYALAEDANFSLVSPPYLERLLNEANVYFQRYNLNESKTTTNIPPHWEKRNPIELCRLFWAISTKKRQRERQESVSKDEDLKSIEETREIMDALDDLIT